MMDEAVKTSGAKQLGRILQSLHRSISPNLSDELSLRAILGLGAANVKATLSSQLLGHVGTEMNRYDLELIRSQPTTFLWTTTTTTTTISKPPSTYSLY